MENADVSKVRLLLAGILGSRQNNFHLLSCWYLWECLSTVLKIIFSLFHFLPIASTCVGFTVMFSFSEEMDLDQIVACTENFWFLLFIV